MAIIDTEGTFRPERIGPIAERFNLDKEAVLGNVWNDATCETVERISPTADNFSVLPADCVRTSIHA